MPSIIPLRVPSPAARESNIVEFWQHAGKKENEFHASIDHAMAQLIADGMVVFKDGKLALTTLGAEKAESGGLLN